MTTRLKNELKNHCYTIEEETVISLEMIKRDRLSKGLPFDEKFKEDFLHAANTMYLSVYHILIIEFSTISIPIDYQFGFSRCFTEFRLCDTLEQFLTVEPSNSIGFVNTDASQLPANIQAEHAKVQSDENHGSGTKDIDACHQSQCTEVIDLVSDDEFEEKPNVDAIARAIALQDF